jgi:hypothetical protein
MESAEDAILFEAHRFRNLEMFLAKLCYRRFKPRQSNRDPEVLQTRGSFLRQRFWGFSTDICESSLVTQ